MCGSLQLVRVGEELPEQSIPTPPWSASFPEIVQPGLGSKLFFNGLLAPTCFYLPELCTYTEKQSISRRAVSDDFESPAEEF